MTKYVHIVYVHPVENCEPQLHKVIAEFEADTKEAAIRYAEWYNEVTPEGTKLKQAVYYGCIDDETGELI